jgi:hypothetical protein
MGCSCKTGQAPNSNKKNNNNNINTEFVVYEKNKIIYSAIGYFFKTIAFLLGVLLLPIINIAIVWFMFNTLVLTKEVNIKGLFDRLMKSKKFRELSKEDDDDDYYDGDDDEFENLTEDDVIMVDVEDITDKVK